MPTLLRPGMGTEHASKLIAALVWMTRPLVCLEVGAGDSTIAIAQAMSDARVEERGDIELIRSTGWSERAELLRPATLCDRPPSRFVSIDNCSGRGTSAEEAWSIVRGHNLQDVQFEPVKADFFELPESIIEHYGKADLVWLDAGTVADDTRFLGALFKHLNEGGIIAMHEPYCAASVQDGNTTRLAIVRNPLWEQIVKSRAPDVDVLSVPEMHKYRQSGIGIIRKRYKWEVNRHQEFEQELIELRLAPVRLDVPGLIPVIDRNERQWVPVNSEECRKVYQSVGLGADSVSAISQMSGVSEEVVEISIGSLIDAGFVISSEGGYMENLATWQKGWIRA